MASAISEASPGRPTGTESAEPLEPAGVAGVLVDPGAHHARRHPDHAHVVAGHLLRQPGRERVDAGLRGGVLDVLAGRAERRGAPS